MLGRHKADTIILMIQERPLANIKKMADRGILPLAKIYGIWNESVGIGHTSLSALQTLDLQFVECRREFQEEERNRFCLV